MDSSVKLTGATVAVMALLSIVAGWYHFEAPLRELMPLKAVASGMVLPHPSGYAWSSSKQTLILALRVGCPHCENEMDFYEQIGELSKRHGATATLVAVFPDSEKDVRSAYLGRLMAMQKLTAIDFRSFHIVGTPTLMLVSETGVVGPVWLGELRPDQKAEILKAISLSAGN